eukprot:m.438136 g.438136  ORF g.438136 m.438136 type:complete len:69 (-) comp20274_c3_seq4:110-316(-)
MSTEHHNGFRPSSAAVMAEEEVRFGPTGKIETVTEHVNDGVPAEDSEEHLPCVMDKCKCDSTRCRAAH